MKPATGAVLKICGDLELFSRWRSRLGNVTASSPDLAAIVSCDVSLLDRLLMHLVAENLLDLPQPGRFQQTEYTLALCEGSGIAWVNYLYDAALPAFAKLPAYLADHGYSEPSDATWTAFHAAKGWNPGQGTLFDYYAANPAERDTFHIALSGLLETRSSWLDVYTAHDCLIPTSDAIEATTAILVDVGGGLGHDLEAFRIVYPSAAKRLVLQDRPEVLEHSICASPVQKTVYDFFTPQPVRGARAYYLRGVLHDWPDPQAAEILLQLRSAMVPGFSKLLIHENVLPGGMQRDQQLPHPEATAYDLSMMVVVAGRERTADAWHKLFRSVGIRIIQIWSSPKAPQSVIECEVDENWQSED